MMDPDESKKQIVKSSSIIGGASVFSIVIGLIKMKTLSILLGPSGIGLMSLLTLVMSIFSTIAAMGMQSSGVRQIALADNDIEILNVVRRALWIANIVLGCLGGLALWLFRVEISGFVLGDVNRVNDVGLLGLGVFLTLIAGSQTALLQGLRKISELAMIKVFSALFSTILGILAIYFYGDSGLLVFILATPFAGVLVAWFYCLRLPRPENIKINLSELFPQWRSLLNLGLAFMLADLMALSSQLLTQYMINQKMGLDGVGYFQASWVISKIYIGFVLGAMATEYYPRLTGIIQDKKAARVLINEQAEIALVLSAPVLLAMLSLSPIIIPLLYSHEFSPSVQILRWQVIGDIFKVACWPLGFILLALGKGKIFILTQLVWNLIFLTCVYFGFDKYGISITGIGFFVAYAIQLLLNLYLAKKYLTYYMPVKLLKIIFIVLLLSSFIFILSEFYNILSVIVGSGITFIFLIYTIREISKIGLLPLLLRSR